MRGAVSTDDVVVRLGGDEFLVVIFEDNVNAINAVVDRLTQRLQQPVVLANGQVLEVSAAVGQSHTSGPVLKLDDLLRDSDEAMYQSKMSVERTVVIPPIPPLPTPTTIPFSV